MKKELLFAFTAFFFMSLSAITGAYALEKEEVETVIYNNKLDYFHDGTLETIQLKGIAAKEDKKSFKELALEVYDSTGTKKSAQIEGGYHPTLQMVDIDKSKNQAMLLKVLTDEKGSNAANYLYTFAHKELKELALPELPGITSEFKADYKAELTIEGLKTYSFNLVERKERYEKLGIYRKGQLNEPTEMMVQPYSSLTTMIYHHKPAFKGKQKICGVADSDTIAYMETIWTRSNNKWKLEKIKMKEISKKL
ncbi:hypothetical protein [Niallia sp. 03133]|uniref:hypothetical protein n=1 Tax=Niallia sp. 03133 TaxID=3458060 RepID=UPI0040449C20